MGSFDIKIKMSPLQGNKRTWAKTLNEFMTVVTRNKGQNPVLLAKIGEALELDDVDEMLRNPCRDALKFILQAKAQGQMEKPEQVSLVLGQLLEIIAPPGSDNRKFANQFAQQIGKQNAPA